MGKSTLPISSNGLPAARGWRRIAAEPTPSALNLLTDRLARANGCCTGLALFGCFDAAGGDLPYNPYSTQYAALQAEISEAQAEAGNRLANLEWHKRFEGDKAFSALCVLRRCDLELKRNHVEIIHELEKRNSRVDVLTRETQFGLDPRDWFSAERSAKKRELDEQQRMLARLTSQRDELQHRIHATDEQMRSYETDLKRYRRFDALEAEATVRALNAHVAQLSANLEELRPLKEKVDQQLAEPLAELGKQQRRRNTLQSEIARAEDFERRLSNASNSYERRLVHDECATTFSESKPARVVGARQRELESIDRSIGKLQERLRSIEQRASRIIKTLVIDGNNLCYEHQTFIGLPALQVVTQRLSSEHTVIVVFDATIRRKLQMNDRDIAARFGDAVKVHVVASKQKADETILDAAADTHTYVISNDRFGDFPDKPVVRDQRLIKHEILNGKILVHDLSITETFTTAV